MNSSFNPLVSADMQAVDAVILQALHSEVALIAQIGNYIIQSGGKRLRPQITVLCARAAGYHGTQHHQLAAIVEFIHTATLLHDDVVDSSTLRRGNQTANALFGNEAAVLVGDFLYSRAFEMMVELNSMRIMSILATTTTIIAEGEVMQLLNIGDADISEARYLEVIQSKTAQLFQAASQLGAVLAGASQTIEDALLAYGKHLGTAFQLIDDALDYDGEQAAIGKNIGDDLAEGKPTLPLIYVIGNCPADADMVRDAIKNADTEKLPAIQRAILESGALAYTREFAHRQAQLAIKSLAPLPESNYKQALIELANSASVRSA